MARSWLEAKLLPHSSHWRSMLWWMASWCASSCFWLEKLRPHTLHVLFTFLFLLFGGSIVIGSWASGCDSLRCGSSGYGVHIWRWCASDLLELNLLPQSVHCFVINLWTASVCFNNCWKLLKVRLNNGHSSFIALARSLACSLVRSLARSLSLKGVPHHCFHNPPTWLQFLPNVLGSWGSRDPYKHTIYFFIVFGEKLTF